MVTEVRLFFAQPRARESRYASPKFYFQARCVTTPRRYASIWASVAGTLMRMSTMVASTCARTSSSIVGLAWSMVRFLSSSLRRYCHVIADTRSQCLFFRATRLPVVVVVPWLTRLYRQYIPLVCLSAAQPHVIEVRQYPASKQLR